MVAVRQRKREASLSKGAEVGSMKLGVCCLPSLRCLSVPEIEEVSVLWFIIRSLSPNVFLLGRERLGPWGVAARVPASV